MMYLLVGLLLISFAFNIYLVMRNQELQRIINQHADALTEHVTHTDADDDETDS